MIALTIGLSLTLEGIRGGGGVGWVSGQVFLPLNFCSFTNLQMLWHNCLLFVRTSFDLN